MKNIFSRLFTFAVTKGIIIFVFAVSFAQIAKSALIEAKYGNYIPIMVWILLIVLGWAPLEIITKHNKRK